MQKTRIWTDFQYFNEKCAMPFYIHNAHKDAKNKKIKIFKFSLALYQILFKMYSGLCKKNLVLVGTICMVLGFSCSYHFNCGLNLFAMILSLIAFSFCFNKNR